MNHRQLYMCCYALFDDGWGYPEIASALGITEQEVADKLTGADRRGIDPILSWDHDSVRDFRSGYAFHRHPNGDIAKWHPPMPSRDPQLPPPPLPHPMP